MADKQKKMAAALAAVNAYLQMEENAAAEQDLLAQSASEPIPQQSYWSQSGRQDMMLMRRLIQMRTFANFR